MLEVMVGSGGDQREWRIEGMDVKETDGRLRAREGT